MDPYPRFGTPELKAGTCDGVTSWGKGDPLLAKSTSEIHRCKLRKQRFRQTTAFFLQPQKPVVSFGFRFEKTTNPLRGTSQPSRPLTHLCFFLFLFSELAGVVQPDKWLWVKHRHPKMACPGKWKHGPKPAVPCLFNFDPYPNGLKLRKDNGKTPYQKWPA